jgi:hypothetical protein
MVEEYAIKGAVSIVVQHGGKTRKREDFSSYSCRFDAFKVFTDQLTMYNQYQNKSTRY